MDSDQATPENFDQVTSDDQGTSQGRYYDCTFCKRGFSNAQALGGHMNIHRKEKAQLKRFVNGTQRVEETPLHSPIPRNSSWPSETKPRDKRTTVKWPWVSSQQGDATTRDRIHVGEFQEFPLFFETPSDENQKPGSQLRGETENASSSSTHVSSGSEIDLELRLGSRA